ncbi:MAG: sulfatase-like hydrolase/transferase [Pseudomonadota bacterium]
MPNALIICSDEHRADALGCAGHGLVKTPNLDRLAGRGVRFTNAYTPSPICVPARAAMATGRYAHQTGYWDNAMAYDGRVPSWGHALREVRASCVSIGKLHYRNVQDDTGFARQIRPMHVKDGVGMIWGSVRDPLPEEPRTDDMLGPIGAGYSAYNAYDEAVACDAVTWLAEPPEEPWCLFTSFVAPHFPLTVPEEFLALYDDVPLPELRVEDGYTRHPWLARMYAFFLHDERLGSDEARKAAIRAYYGLCSFMDHQVGRVLDALQASGQAEETLVIYLSDHGECLGNRNAWGKSVLYGEATRVPLILAGPGVNAGTCETPVDLTALAPTLASVFDASWESGLDLRALAAGPDDRTRIAFSEYHAAGAPTGAFMVADADWAYHHYEGYAPELFDLNADSGQAVNLAGRAEHAATEARMKAALLAICDPEAVNRAALAAQAALVEASGGREAALGIGPLGATPVPE